MRSNEVQSTLNLQNDLIIFFPMCTLKTMTFGITLKIRQARWGSWIQINLDLSYNDEEIEFNYTHAHKAAKK